MSVHKNKTNNTWYIKYKNITRRGYKTKNEAQKAEAQLRLSTPELSTHILISDVAEDYLKYKRNKVTYKTYAKEDSIINNIILPNIENKYIDRISEYDCRLFHDYIATLPYSSRYKNEIKNVYIHLFEHAIVFYRLGNNPTKVMTPFKKTYEEKKKKRERETFVWTEEEFHKFSDCLDRTMFKEFFVTLFYTGMRKSEALALTWKDYSYTEATLYVTKGLSRDVEHGLHIKDPKNPYSERIITLSTTLNEYLFAFKMKESKIYGYNEDWYIFGREKPLASTTIDRVKKKAIEKSGVKPIRTHDFRHSHGSILLNDGANILAVSRRLGHADVNTTLRVYSHLMKSGEDHLSISLEKTSQKLLK